ncbi:DMT family transporter [Shimia ponticola]|uniref:DMT family transporter n=1 Tax=Shimia ponticola TaxID=2582893 RepID=UPI0011BFAA72|nr:DMT family transporter [Shimia ponticola]
MLRAVLIMCIAMSCIPAGDTFGKLLTSQGVAPIFVAFTRFAIASFVLLPFLPKGTFAALRHWQLWLRAALITGGITSILTALSTEPIANVFGAFFIGPVVSYALSAWLLGETASPLRTVLLLIGFVGVLMVVQPGFDMRPGLLFAVLAGCFYGAFLTASKWVVGLAPPLTLLFSQLALSAVFTAPFGLMAIPALTFQLSTFTVFSSLFSMAGNLLLIYAFTLADSTRLAPFVYFQIVAATVLGAVIFSELPDALSAAGIAVILLSGFATLFLRAPRSTRANIRG